MAERKSETNLDNQPKNPSRREFFKKGIEGASAVIAARTLSTSALLAILSTESQAQEIELSPEEEHRRTISDLLNKDKYGTGSKNYGPGYNEAWGVEKGETMSIHGSIPTSFTNKEFREATAFYSRENY